MWYRCRFKVDEDDYRPVKWPPPGPYWCTGYDNEGRAILIAFVKSTAQLEEYWPDYIEDSYESRTEITYTDRFPPPAWMQQYPCDICNELHVADNLVGIEHEDGDVEVQCRYCVSLADREKHFGEGEG